MELSLFVQLRVNEEIFVAENVTLATKNTNSKVINLLNICRILIVGWVQIYGTYNATNAILLSLVFVFSKTMMADF